MPEMQAPCLKPPPARFPRLRSAIIQDGAPVGPRELEARVMNVAAKLREVGCNRVALCTDAAATVAVGLAAGAAAECEVALLRRGPAGTPDLRGQSAGIARLDDDLNLYCPGPMEPRPAGGFSVLIASSGTTGTPKLTRHTIDRLAGRIRRPPAGHGKGRWLLAYHPATFAGVQVILTALMLGDDLIAVSDLQAAPLAEAALAHGATLASGTPSFWRSLLTALGDRAERLALDHVTLGGETADQATLDRLKSAFPGAVIAHIYASTEAGALFSVKDGRAGFPADWLEHPVDGVGLRIREGILEVRSPRSMHGYVGAGETANAPYDEEGWLNTGDAVARSGARVLFLGRSGTVINVGGFKVSPEEVEAALLEVEGVADARVYGTKNPITGALVSADIVLEGSRDQEKVRDSLVSHARARLDSHKVPRVIRFVDDIELNRSGKKARRR